MIGRAIYIATTLALLAVSLTGCSGNSVSTEALISRPAPGARITLLSGEQLPLSAYRGKKTVLFFWDSRCARSNSILRSLRERSEELSQRQDLTIVTVSIDKLKDIDRVKERLASLSTSPFVHAFSGNDTLDEAYYSFYGNDIPLFVLLDRDGVVRAVGSSEGDFDEMINK